MISQKSRESLYESDDICLEDCYVSAVSCAEEIVNFKVIILQPFAQRSLPESHVLRCRKWLGSELKQSSTPGSYLNE
jgi:hypothetical protein